MDLLHARDAQGARGRPKGRTGRAHVVDQEHARCSMKTARRKRASYVLLPFVMRKIDLTPRIARSPKPPQARRHAE